jgi:hypothetical protein
MLRKKIVNTDARLNEVGGAKISLLVVVVVLGSLIHAGYHYLPVVYQAESFKTEMHTAQVQLQASPWGQGTPADRLKTKLRKLGNEYGVPADAEIVTSQSPGGGITARVTYNKEVPILPFGIYTLDYTFDSAAY